MSFFSDIQAAATGVNINSVTYFQEAFRNDSESFNYDSFPIVNILTNYSETITKSKGGALISNARYNIQFLDIDEWDNRTNDNAGDQAEESSIEIIQRLTEFANGVLYKFCQDTTLALTSTQSISWTITPLYRITSNTMSGVNAVINYSYYANKEGC